MKPLLIPLLRQLADGRFHSGELLARSLNVSRATIWQILADAEAIGARVFRVRGKGYRLEAPLEFLDAATVNARLDQASPIRLEVIDTLESTNSYLLEAAAKGAPHGIVIATELQTRGRGRHGRRWHAGFASALSFSLLWRFQDGVAGLSGLSLSVGLSVAQACEALGVKQVKLKWPNDVIHGGRKLAGILIEVHGEILGPSVAVIGIGVNYRLTGEAREAIDQPVVDLATIANPLPSRNTVLAELLRSLARVLTRFERGGFAPLAAEWEARHAYQMKPVRIVLPDRSKVEGVAEGVGPDGALRLRTAQGGLKFSVGEVSLRGS